MTEDEAHNLCKSVFYDVTSFLASDETSFLFSKQQQLSDAKKQFTKEWAKFTKLEGEFNAVTGVVCKLFFGYQNKMIAFAASEHGKKYLMGQVGDATRKALQAAMMAKKKK